MKIDISAGCNLKVRDIFGKLDAKRRKSRKSVADVLRDIDADMDSKFDMEIVKSTMMDSGISRMSRLWNSAVMGIFLCDWIT